MRHGGVLLAAALVLAADAFVLVRVAHNRSGPPATAIELTERELRLVRPFRESTAWFLRLTWGPSARSFRFEDGPGWFDKSKLEELGYDCRSPLNDPEAVARYRAMPAREAFAVLEYSEGSGNGLVAVDAGRDFTKLRSKYADTRRYLIAPCLVRLIYQTKWDPVNRREAPGAYLRGTIAELLVSEIAVPPSQRGVFAGLSETADRSNTSPGPRYSALLYYGKDHEPWIGPCRRLTPAPGL
jgi:hypothetical protein